MKQIANTLLFIFFLFFIPKTCFGREFLVSNTIKIPHNLSSEVNFFEDPTSKLSFEQIKRKSFKKNNANRILLPFANQATWLKLALKNNTSSDSVFYFFIDNPIINKTTLYTENQTDSTVFEAFKIREVSKLKSPYFRINLKQGESKDFYFKLESQRGIYLIVQLYDSKGFEKLHDSRKIALGFMSGLTWMVIFIVFTIGFLVVKDNKSRAYAIFTFIRTIGFWSSSNVIVSLISVDSLVSEKIIFVFMSVSPMISAFLALNILPFDKLPRWIKSAIYGFILVNFLLLIYLWGSYGPNPLKYLVVLSIASHSFFYCVFIFTLVKKINEYPYYSIPFLVGSFTNFVLNLRVLGIINFDYIIQLTVLSAILEIAVYVYYLSYIFRISVKKQAEKLKNLSFEAEKATKLEELDKLKTRFFTNISHEFRTPLTLLVGPIDDLQKKYPQEGIISTMQRNLQRLQTLINQILDLSKLEAGEIKTNFQEVDLTNFLNQLFASFESLAQSKNIIFSHSPLETKQFALADSDKLEKIITNLLSNAFKFTPANGRISIRIQFIENQLRLKVEDTGIGIEQARLDKIFDRFYQAEDHKHYEGTGIGLALVKELVDLLNGTIKVNSELGRGTTFNLALPFTPIEKLSGQPLDFGLETGSVQFIDNEQNHKLPVVNRQSLESIMLIVEDNSDLRNYVASIFENDYQLVLAVDGEEGLAKAIEFVPDVVISDLMMPKLDGLGFCEQLKNDERTNHIPVVMLTAKASIGDKLIGLKHGADDYLAKPFNKEELTLRVENLVHQRALMRAKYSAQAVEIVQIIEEVKEPTLDELFIQKAKNIIDKHLDKSSFDVEEFADNMNLSPVQLRRKIKAITDHTVTEFVRNHRLEIAASMLKKGEYNVSEIAYRVGFESLPYFSKVFQERYGKTASEWR